MSGLTLNCAVCILLFFAGDMVIFGKSVNDLKQSLDLLKQYCYKSGLGVKHLKTKIMVLKRKGDIFENESCILMENCLKLLTMLIISGDVSIQAVLPRI